MKKNNKKYKYGHEYYAFVRVPIYGSLFERIKKAIKVIVKKEIIMYYKPK